MPRFEIADAAAKLESLMGARRIAGLRPDSTRVQEPQGAGVHLSDSAEQRAVEPVLLADIGRRIGHVLTPRTLKLGGGARVDVDGVADDESVLVELFAHQGRLRGGQFHKVARDALKLITLRRDYPDARLVLGFADPEAAACVTGASWLSEALQTWEIEVFVTNLDDERRDALQAAQARQVMINPVP